MEENKPDILRKRKMLVTIYEKLEKAVSKLEKHYAGYVQFRAKNAPFIYEIQLEASSESLEHEILIDAVEIYNLHESLESLLPKLPAKEFKAKLKETLEKMSNARIKYTDVIDAVNFSKSLSSAAIIVLSGEIARLDAIIESLSVNDQNGTAIAISGIKTDTNDDLHYRISRLTAEIRDFKFKLLEYRTPSDLKKDKTDAELDKELYSEFSPEIINSYESLSEEAPEANARFRQIIKDAMTLFSDEAEYIKTRASSRDLAIDEALTICKELIELGHKSLAWSPQSSTTLHPGTPRTNILAYEQLFAEAKDFIFILDKHVDVTCLNACLKAKHVKEIKILSASPSFNKNLNDEFKKALEDTKKELEQQGVKLSVNILDIDSSKEDHDRFFIDKEIIYNIPSSSVVAKNSLSQINKTGDRDKILDWFKKALARSTEYN